MTPAEQIVETALRIHPDLIGLSGLITPSLDEMVHVVSELKKAGITTPVLIGGATTSRLHTALRIAPTYDGPVIWVKDASQNAGIANRFLNPETKDVACAELYTEQEQLRTQAPGKQQQLMSFDEAQQNKLNLF